jgi:hypothetical protein
MMPSQIQSLKTSKKKPCGATKRLWRALKKGIKVDSEAILMLAIIYVRKHTQVEFCG